MIKIRSTVLLTLGAFLFLGTLYAQDRDHDRDEGAFLILNAQYGTEHRHVDVTQRLRELARSDRQFLVDNRTLNVDPAYGRPKMLRVFARGPNGEERFFDFPEGATFDGAQFRGWGRADWGDEHWNGGWNGREEHAEHHEDRDRGRDYDAGEFFILSAQYGTERRHVDVTPRLRELARADLRFQLDNHTFGVDPDYGHRKVLRIYARRLDGPERMFEYPEHSWVDGSQFRGWRSGEWEHGDYRWSGRWTVENHER